MKTNGGFVEDCHFLCVFMPMYKTPELNFEFSSIDC